MPSFPMTSKARGHGARVRQSCENAVVMANVDAVKNLAGEILREAYEIVPLLRQTVEDFAEGAVVALKPSVMLRGETVAVSFDAPKTTALLYDRVWTPDYREIPESVGVMSATDEEMALRIVLFCAETFFRGIGHANETAERWSTLGRAISSKRVVSRLRKDGISAVPTYRSADECGNEYRSGSHEVVIGVLRDVALPIEAELSWEQILELRNDTESRRKLLHFKHWLDTDMIGRSPSFISDEIAIRLHTYNEALRKHGVKTILGTLATALDAKVLVGGAAAVASLSYAADPVAAMLAGAAIVAGTVAVHFARVLLDTEDIRSTTNPEIAFIAEVAGRGKRLRP